jgi:hypothetical protein
MNRNSKNPQRRPKFGQAAKVINLYIKQYLLRPSFMGKQEAARAQTLYGYAHVPLDGIVLEHVWVDFGKELSGSGPPKLNRLEKEEYIQIQEVIALHAKKSKLPPLAYDFKWTERER